jgi:hypothetical protein
VLGVTGGDMAAIREPRTVHMEQLLIAYNCQPTVERGMLQAEALAVLRRATQQRRDPRS